MGRCCQRAKEGKGNRTLSRRRKSRRLLTLRRFRQPKELLDTDSSAVTGTSGGEINQIVLEHDYIGSSGNSDKENLPDSQDSDHVINDASSIIIDVIETTKKTDSMSIERGESDNMPNGRRIFDVGHLFKQLFAMGEHPLFKCSISNMYVTGEIKKGFKSIFTLKCKMCSIEVKLSTEDEEDVSQNTIDVNHSATLACISTGIGYSELEEISAAMNIPMMAFDTYAAKEANVAEIMCQTAWKIMEEAAAEESRLARALGEVDKDGIPCITVVTDGAWSKRSYNVNYDALSGVACIIGERTGKLLFLAVRNKYCSVCSRAVANNTSPNEHLCFRNWSGPSTAMETDSIAEGFKQSLQLHGLKYTRMVGDGDSSVYRKLKEIKPYGNQLVEKVECRNHLLRNFSSKLRELITRKRSNSKNLPVPPGLRKLLDCNAHRLRIAVVQATKYRSGENNSLPEKLAKLEGDLQNVSSHVFGEHAECSKINYFRCNPAENEKNMVPTMKECGLFQDIQTCFARLNLNLHSLILNMDTNTAEHYNSIVCKFVGGKRKNYSLRRGYQTRCEAAAIAYNSGADYLRQIHHGFVKKTPTKYMKSFIARKRRISENRNVRRNLFGKKYYKKKSVALPDLDYGPHANNQEDMSPEEYAAEQEKFLRDLQKSREEICEIEKETRSQSASQKWKQERHVRLTASNFGEICRMRISTSCQNMVKRLLYSTFRGTKSTQWGVDHEPLAIEEFSLTFGYTVSKCGLFIDPVHHFLGASPDGLVGDDAIIEVKCPATCADATPEEGIHKKLVKFAEIRNGELYLKRSHPYFYQVQGQLAITQRRKCFFVIWTPKGMLVEEIPRHMHFWEEKILPNLKIFYFNCVLPELINSREQRQLPIRNPPRKEIMDYVELTQY